jgi:divalent metal cation (Fe/Co/Zn/Cd) transporter
MSENKNVIRQITIAMFFFTVLGSFFKLIFIFLIHPQVVLADSAHHGSNIIGSELDIHK